MVGPEPNGEVIPSDDFGRLLDKQKCFASGKCAQDL